MRPGSKPVMAGSGWGKLGLVLLLVLVTFLTLGGCASSPKQASPALPQIQPDQQETPSKSTRAKKEGNPPAASPVPVQGAQSASSGNSETDNPLKAFSMVAEEDLREMRGCLGVYYFDFSLDINVQTLPQVNISSKFTAAVPDGTSPSFNGTTVMFKDDNVLYVAGPTGTGLLSEVIVTGRDNIVVANTQFNIHIPNSTFIAPTINIMPAPTLTGIVPK